MTKKSLVFGAAALGLLALLTIIGCSNPSSGSTEYVTQAGSDYPYPADTVQVNTRGALDGLLNDYSAETNQVRNIAFTGATAALNLASPLIIPAGKTVYLTQNHTAANIKRGNITVREGAKLVLVGDFTAGNGFAVTSASGDNDAGFLLIKGELEVFRGLTVTNNARDVSDYTIENNIEVGRNSVIGRNVTILPGATLTLHISDIIPPLESQPNKFTPAQAWAAAGQGNLVIGNAGSIPGRPGPATPPTARYADALTAYNYTVTELLTGVSPNATRSYTVTSGRITEEELPALIPQGAYILTRAIPKRSVGNTLTVNGFLTTNGTLSDITKIDVGNGGKLELTEAAGELLQALADLKLGPGADFSVASPDISLKSLETLFLGDGSSIAVPTTATGVTFKEDNELALTLGKDVTYQVVMSPSASVNTVITKDASLVGGSTLVVYPGSTFTVNEDITFTVDGGSTFDISRLPVPAADAAPAITINGAIEVANGTFIGPYATVPTNLAVLYQTIALGSKGKVLLDSDDAVFSFGRAADPLNQLYVSSSTATYTWDGSGDGAQIELNAGGLVIRDTDDGVAAVTIGAAGAVILKSHKLYLDRNVTLELGTGLTITLQGDTEANNGGAKLLGPGKLTATANTIGGGDDGWQVLGDNLVITESTGSFDISSPIIAPATTSVATFKALGLGASIFVDASTTLTIAADITINLNGTLARKNGEIILADTAEISLAEDDSVILTMDPAYTGASAGHTSAIPLAGSTVGIGVSKVDAGAFSAIGITNLKGDDTDAKAMTTAAPNLTANTLPAGRLVSLIGTASGSATATANGAEVRINSETPTAADNT